MEGRGCWRESRLLVQLILVLFAFVNVAFCKLSEEISGNSLAVKFDEIYTIEKWTETMTDGFTSSVTTAMNSHCMNSAEFAKCQISTYNSSFTVVLSAESPMYFNGDIVMTFYVMIPEADRAPDADMEYVVPLDTVTTVMKANIDAINNATDQKIVFIGDNRIIPLDKSMDTIMIPIVCVLFLVVVFLAVCLTCMQTRGEKKVQEQRAHQVGSKGDEGITLTAVKSGSYASDDNNGDSTTSKTGKKFRRQKKRKDGQETSATRAPVQVQPVVQSSSNGSKTSIEVKPAHDSPTDDNFSSNNSNDLILPMRSGSRHAIELPPLTTVSTPRKMSLNGSDSEDKDRKKDKKKKKHHRKLSKQSLVDAIDKDEENEDDKSLSPLPEDNQGS